MRLPSKRVLLLLSVPAVLVILAVGLGVWWLFFRGDAPPEADIETAGETLRERETAEQTGDTDDSLDGTWTVDRTIGSFDYAADDFSGTYAGYRVQEELAQIGSNTAVGRTPDVTGEITIEGDQLVAAAFEVDTTTLVSDEGFRDNALTTRGLETNTYPTASFSLTEPLTLPPNAGSGAQLALTAIGELTLHGTTNEIAIELDAELDGDAIAVVGSAPVTMADYNIEPPTAPVVVSVRDEGTFEFQVFLTRS